MWGRHSLRRCSGQTLSDAFDVEFELNSERFVVTARKSKVKSVGQECPTHTGKVKGKGNPKVKSVGQSLP